MATQTNLLWTEREYCSLEDCLVETTATGSKITSTLIGLYEGKIYQVKYRIQTNSNWETVLVKIKCQHNNQIQSMKQESDGKGHWLHNGQKANQFAEWLKLLKALCFVALLASLHYLLNICFFGHWIKVYLASNIFTGDYKTVLSNASLKL